MKVHYFHNLETLKLTRCIHTSSDTKSSIGCSSHSSQKSKDAFYKWGHDRSRPTSTASEKFNSRSTAKQLFQTRHPSQKTTKKEKHER